MSEKSLNIIPGKFEINRPAREKLNGHRAAVLWFTGLSGSGKSTVANLVEQDLHQRGLKTYLLDGDNVRSGLNSDLDFSESGRKENIRRIAEVAKLFADSGTIALVSFISPFKKDREQAKLIIGGDTFSEIFVDASLACCEERDVKGLYKKARSGIIPNFTGIDSPYEAPEHPDIRLDAEGRTAAECAAEVVEFTLSKVRITQ
ncbi:MAG: adenylyl-sulfate kinase [Saprospirales bacterium]|nr:MAG: adenylyl-sulfate kinase [Saprospirales bacterium]